MNTVSTPKPVLLALSILAALDVLTAGAAFTDIVGKDTAGFIILVLAAIKVGVAFYLQGQVTPFANVLAYKPKVNEQRVLAGGAAVQENRQVVSLNTTISELNSYDAAA